MLPKWKIWLIPALAVLFAILFALCLSIAEDLQVDGIVVAGPVLILVVLLSSIVVVLRFAGARKLAAKSQDGVLLLNRGDLEGAARVFDEGHRASARMGLRSYANLFRMNRAAVHTRSGEPLRALEILEPLFAGGHEKGGLAAFRGHMLAQTVLAHTLASQFDAAQKLLAAQESEIPDAQRGLIVLPKAILLGRRGAFDELLALLDSRWDEVEACLPARNLRPLHLVRAFALHQRGDSHGTRKAMAAAGEKIESEAAHLLGHWEELAEFLHRRADYRQPG